MANPLLPHSAGRRSITITKAASSMITRGKCGQRPTAASHPKLRRACSQGGSHRIISWPTSRVPLSFLSNMSGADLSSINQQLAPSRIAPTTGLGTPPSYSFSGLFHHILEQHMDPSRIAPTTGLGTPPSYSVSGLFHHVVEQHMDPSRIDPLRAKAHRLYAVFRYCFFISNFWGPP
jgi:hypothetical protein